MLLQHVWCPPAAPEVRYEQDALLAATFVPGGSNNEIFAVGGDGQLLFWNGERSLSPTRSLFEKPKPANPQQIVQPGFASFSPDGRWLLIIPPTLASAADGESAVQGAPTQGTLPARRQCWPRAMQNSDLAMVDAESNVRAHGRGLGNSAASRFPYQLCLVSGVRSGCPYQCARHERGRMRLFRVGGKHFPRTRR